MKHLIALALVVVLTASTNGCLLSGQIVIIETISTGETSDTAVNKYLVDLNENDDYAEHGDKIKSVDGIAIVAAIRNNLSTSAKATVYVSNDETLNTVSEVEANADLVFISPTVPGDSNLNIGWMEGISHMVDAQPIIDEILGDGIFWVYAIADEKPFSLDINGAVAITLTVGK